MKKTLQEFKAFAMKGNIVDLAVGVVIGTAFGKIVTSLVSDIFMPILGAFTAGVNIKDLAWSIPVPSAVGEITTVDIKYGSFLQVTLDFIIIAFCIFWVVKIISKAMPKKEKEEEAPKGPTSEELLTEIRDLLKK